jgi:hypothetical protein
MSWAPPMRPTMQAFMEEVERWTKGTGEGRDVRPLRDAAIKHLRAGVYLSEFAPCLAAVHFSLVEFDGTRGSRVRDAWSRGVMNVMLWLLEYCVYRNRPMWNDFRMAMWALSRDPFYVFQLHEHLKRARDKGIHDQFWSGQWMVSSVCQQDSEFKKEWEHACQLQGEVFA